MLLNGIFYIIDMQQDYHQHVDFDYVGLLNNFFSVV
jgi:hypothetical protein